MLAAALTGASGSQTIEIDARDGRFDVLRSVMRDPAGNLVWEVENKDFAPVAGSELRVPGKNRFVSSAQKSDVIVAYEAREVNVELPAQAFVLPSVAGLPACP